MRTRSSITRALSIVLLVGASWSGASAVAQAQGKDPEPRFFDPSARYRIPLGDAPARGPADALITIVEFSDFICRYCDRAQATLLDLERLYPGEIRLVYRHNPLDLEDAGLAAEASMAARAQGQFWPMHDLIFGVGGRVSRAHVDGFALALGLDMGRFRRDLDRRAQRARIEVDAALAGELGIYSTPSFFINGRPVMGAAPLDVFVRIIDEERERAQALIRDGVPRADLYAHLMASARERGEDMRTLDRAQAQASAARYAPVELDPGYLYRVGPGLPGHRFGPADAPVIVTVFTDFECPYCAQLFPVLEEVRTTYPDQIQIVFRHLPLQFHPRAQLAAEAAVAAAAEGRLGEFQKRVFADPQGLTRAALTRHARAAGLDMAGFARALDERRYLEPVMADMAAGAVLGVRGTPTLFVNGTPIPGGAPFAALDRHVFRPKLSEADGLIEAGVAPAEVYETLLRNAGSERVRGEGEGGAIDVASLPGFGDPADDAAGQGGGDPAPGAGASAGRDERQRAALLRACRVGDRARARDLYGKLAPGERHEQVRAQCQPFGVDLPAPPATPESR